MCDHCVELYFQEKHVIRVTFKDLRLNDVYMLESRVLTRSDDDSGIIVSAIVPVKLNKLHKGGVVTQHRGREAYDDRDVSRKYNLKIWRL